MSPYQKQTSPIWSIRKTDGPAKETIKETLELINPIIFAESRTNYTHCPERNFCQFNMTLLTGYRFKYLCQALYRIICLKRRLSFNDIRNIATLTNRDYTKVCNLVADSMAPGTENTIETQETRRTRITEIGMEDITNVRQRAERSNQNMDNPAWLITPHTNQTSQMTFDQNGIITSDTIRRTLEDLRNYRIASDTADRGCNDTNPEQIEQ